MCEENPAGTITIPDDLTPEELAGTDAVANAKTAEIREQENECLSWLDTAAYCERKIAAFKAVLAGNANREECDIVQADIASNEAACQHLLQRAREAALKVRKLRNPNNA